MKKNNGPQVRNFSAVECGTYRNRSVFWVADQFMWEADGDLRKVPDQYDVGMMLYRHLKNESGWTHEDAAEAFGVSRRTAEGMSQGRISLINRRKLAKMLTL